MAISLSDLNNINNRGLIVPDRAEDNRLGKEACSAGDIDIYGNGIVDLAITAMNAGIPTNDEYSYDDSDRHDQACVVFSSADRRDTIVNLDNPNLSYGFAVSGLMQGCNLGGAVLAII